MKFPYSINIVTSVSTGEEIVSLRPEIEIEVSGPKGTVRVTALVDTGADNCVFPRSLATKIGVDVHPGAGIGAIAFGGQSIDLAFGEVDFCLTDGGEELQWSAQTYFAGGDTDSDATVVLGHEGFLDYFVAVFDGKNCELTLTPTDELPSK